MSDASAGGWEAWDRFVESTPASGFMQSSWWSEFRTTTGWRHFSAVLRSEGAIAGGAIVQRLQIEPGLCFYYIQDGPVLPDDGEAAADVFEAMLAAINRARSADPDTVSHLRIEPRWAALPGFVRKFRVPAFHDTHFEPRNTLCIDLRPTEDAILAQMKPKGRYNIRVARRSGVTVVEDASDDGVNDFIALYEETAERQNFSPKPPDYFSDLIATLVRTQRGSAYFAEHYGVRIAGAIVIWFGDRATYFFGGSRTYEPHVMAPYLLHWEIMRGARARGLSWYDFWGVAPVDAIGHVWSDISVFKRKFGGVEVALVPGSDLIFDRATYARYQEIVSGAGRRARQKLATAR